MAKDVTIYKLDVGNYPEIQKKYEVQGIPALVYFKNGKVVGRKLGVHSPKKLKELEEKYFN